MILCSVSDIEEDSSKGFQLSSDLQVFIVKKNGKLLIYENRCPHLGIPLEMIPDQFLALDKSFIQCSTHGALFEIENGLCVAGPCSGASLSHYDFEIIDGAVHIQLDD